MIESVHIEPGSGCHPSSGSGVRGASGRPLPTPRARAPFRVALGLDGAATTGLGVWRVPERLVIGRAGGADFLGAYTLRIGGKRWTEEDTITVIDAAIGDDAEWFVVLEALFLKQLGADGKRRGRPPAHARQHLKRAVSHVARRRAERLGVRHIEPTILEPQPGSWRATTGANAYVARCLGDTKAGAIAFLRDVLGVDVEEHNAAEGACLAYYGARVAQMPIVPRLGGPVVFAR